MQLNDNQMILKTFREQLVRQMMGGQVMVDCVHSSRVFPFHYITGVIKLPIFGGIKQCKCMAIFRDFPWNSSLFGVVSYFDLIMTPGCIFPPGSSCENPPAILLDSKCWHRCIVTRWVTMCQKITCFSGSKWLIPKKLDHWKFGSLEMCLNSSFSSLRCSPHDAKVLKICHWVLKKRRTATMRSPQVWKREMRWNTWLEGEEWG